MITYHCLTCILRFLVILTNYCFSCSFEKVIQKCNHTVLKMFPWKFDFIREQFLAFLTLNKAFHFSFVRLFRKLLKHNFHIIVLYKILIVLGIPILIMNSRLSPNLNKVISGIKQIDVKIIRTMTFITFFIHQSKFLQNINS